MSGGAASVAAKRLHHPLRLLLRIPTRGPGQAHAPRCCPPRTPKTSPPDTQPPARPSACATGRRPRPWKHTKWTLPPEAASPGPGALGFRGLPCVPSMANSLEVQVLYPARWRRRISEAQGRRREARSEGSLEQSRDPMDKNRIRGLPGRTSEQVIAKSVAIKGRGGKSGGCAVKAVGLTSGGLCCVRNPRTERFRKGRDRGAEVSRGHSSRLAGEGPNDGKGY